MTYDELISALKLFGLGERASLKQIKARHRELVKTHHPDRVEGKNPAIIREINAAQAILLAYCANYRFCFSEEEFLEQFPEERLRRQFDGDPAWGGLNDES